MGRRRLWMAPNHLLAATINLFQPGAGGEDNNLKCPNQLLNRSAGPVKKIFTSLKMSTGQKQLIYMRST